MNTLDSLKDKVVSFYAFDTGWDGYTAPPIPTDVITRTLNLIDTLFVEIFPYTFEVFPTARESIQLESETLDSYLEIEILNNSYELYFEDKVNVFSSEQVFDTMDDLVDVICQMDI
jgi:hypothetical protein